MVDVKAMCAEKLLNISKNITVSDRSDSLQECDITRPTLDRYLRGDIVKIDTAMGLIKFFDKRISARVKELSKIEIA